MPKTPEALARDKARRAKLKAKIKKQERRLQARQTLLLGRYAYAKIAYGEPFPRDLEAELKAFYGKITDRAILSRLWATRWG